MRRAILSGLFLFATAAAGCGAPEVEVTPAAAAPATAAKADPAKADEAKTDEAKTDENQAATVDKVGGGEEANTIGGGTGCLPAVNGGCGGNPPIHMPAATAQTTATTTH